MPVTFDPESFKDIFRKPHVILNCLNGQNTIKISSMSIFCLLEKAACFYI